MNSLPAEKNTRSLIDPDQKGYKGFSSLKNRNFRLLWIGGMFSHVGDEMQMVAVSWLVLVLTDSPFLMGIAALFQGLPRLFFGPVGGVIADRKNRHRLLMIYQASEMVLAFLFALMVLSGKIEYWHILVVLPFFGFLKAVYVTARQAYVFDLVGKDDLMNALALHSSGMNLAKIIGPSIAGVLIGVLGVGWCLFINGLSFIGILVSLLMMHPPNLFKKDLHYPSFFQDLRETFVYLQKDKTPSDCDLFLLHALWSSIHGCSSTFCQVCFRRGCDGIWLPDGIHGSGGCDRRVDDGRSGGYTKKGAFVSPVHVVLRNAPAPFFCLVMVLRLAFSHPPRWDDGNVFQNTQSNVGTASLTGRFEGEDSGSLYAGSRGATPWRILDGDRSKLVGGAPGPRHGGWYVHIYCTRPALQITPDPEALIRSSPLSRRGGPGTL
jgi:MFS family permease